jgi:hypothetical protein
MSDENASISGMDADSLDAPLLERFERHSRVADWMAAMGLMGYAFTSVTHWKDYIPDPKDQLTFEAWGRSFMSFVRENGWAPVLALAAILTYVAGRVFARKNIGQLRSMFADENTPTGFRIIGRSKLFLMVYGQLVLVLAMVKYSREVAIPCVGWILLHSMYLYSNYQQRFWIDKIFPETKYAPSESHPHRKFIEARREAARRYVARAHYPRELIVIGSALIAIALEQGQKWGYVGLYGNTAAYAVMIAAVAVNEIIVGAWRVELGRELAKANVAQLICDRKRGL